MQNNSSTFTQICELKIDTKLTLKTFDTNFCSYLLHKIFYSALSSRSEIKNLLNLFQIYEKEENFFSI